jgi:hypothetical protein
MFSSTFSRRIPIRSFQILKRSYALKQLISNKQILTDVGQLSQLNNVNSLYFKTFSEQFNLRIRNINCNDYFFESIPTARVVLNEYEQYRLLFRSLPKTFQDKHVDLMFVLNGYINDTQKNIDTITERINKINTVKQVNDDMDYLLTE